MSHGIGQAAKFGAFAVVMVVLTAFLFLIFGQYRTGSTLTYSAVFKDVSSLAVGDSVRFSGVRVGTVEDMSRRPDNTIVVTFDSDRSVVLTTGTRAAIRYLNLVGDRFLELTDGAGSTRLLPAGAQIPVDRTQSALDLDLLLGGLKPVIKGLDPADVNALSASLIQIIQGQGGTIDSLLSQTSSFTTSLADRSQTVQQLIDDLRSTLATLADTGNDFSGAVDRLQRLVSALSADRAPIGDAIEALDRGTASIADLLTNARPPLAATVDQLSRLAPNLEGEKDRIDTTLKKAPENYRKLVRLGAYGSFFNYYICQIGIRVSDLQDRTAVFPVFNQRGGRCAEPNA